MDSWNDNDKQEMLIKMFEKSLLYNDQNREEVILVSLIIKKFIKYSSNKLLK